jgi:CRP-like cAMP-binding protein
MFRNLEIALQEFVRLTNQEQQLFESKLQAIECSKNETLLKAGETCKAIWFVNEGAFRQMDADDNVINLFTKNEWMLDNKSFTAQKPAVHTIVATEDSELFCLTVHAMHELIQGSPVFFQLGKLLEAGFMNLKYQNNRLTPEEKYELLLREKPQYIQLFPAKTIASFLGIAPETLSRVRRKLIS